VMIEAIFSLRSLRLIGSRLGSEVIQPSLPSQGL
jgi:hypothetical protein